jgi:poly-gamma-glutamate capsule biosynthesis protein CapA/YwtB (metallophosphatase superfamily)
MTERGYVLWKSEDNEPIAARVAVAGDFLPAGKLELPQPDAWDEAARALAPQFEDVATTFVNLECAIDTGGLGARQVTGLGQIVSAPPATLNYLQTIRSVTVGFANNHSYDYGPAGVERTRQALSQRNLALIGAGRTTTNPPEVFVWQGPGGTRVGLWAAAKASHDLARGEATGVEPATLRRAERALELMKSQGARFSIAMLHAGALRTNRLDPADVKLMDSIAAAGFDLVAASHSHRISGSRILGVGRSSPAFCFYGLGSIVSGYIAAPIEREGLIVVAGFKSCGDLASLEIRPVSLAASGFGEVPSAEISQIILNRFQRLSAEVADGSSKRLFYQEISQSLVKLYLRDARAAFRESGILGLARKTARIRMRHLRRLAHGFLP